MHLMHLSLSRVVSLYLATVCETDFFAYGDANKVEISLPMTRDTSGHLAELFCRLPRKS